MRWYHLREDYPIDNVNGIGSVPMNQDVDYFGLRVKMLPYMFTKLALPLNRDAKPELIDLVKKKTPMGAPFLIVEIPDEWMEKDFTVPSRVVGHEGRNRMTAIQQTYGDIPVETHLFLRGAVTRRKNLTDEMISHMRNTMQAEKSSKVYGGPIFFSATRKF